MNERNETFELNEPFTESETGCTMIRCSECGEIEEAGELDSGLCARCEYKQLTDGEE